MCSSDLPSGIEGTRPAVLDQLGFGNCVLVRNTPVNMEVVEESGFSFDRTDVVGSMAARLQALADDPEGVAAMRVRATRRISTYYNWTWVTDFYEQLFRALARGARAFPQYDAFVAERRGAREDLR